MFADSFDAMMKKLSTEGPAFKEFVGRTIRENEAALVLFRWANSGGMQQEWLVRNLQEFTKVLKEGSPKTAVTVFSAKAFSIRGTVSDAIRSEILAKWENLESKDETLTIVRLDTSSLILKGKWLTHVTSRESLETWIKANMGAPFMAGSMRSWEIDSEAAVTAYIPDQDGVVRPGAY